MADHVSPSSPCLRPSILKPVLHLPHRDNQSCGQKLGQSKSRQAQADNEATATPANRAVDPIGVADCFSFNLGCNFHAGCATVLFFSAVKMLSKIHLPSSLPSAGSLARSGCGIKPASGVNGCSKNNFAGVQNINGLKRNNSEPTVQAKRVNLETNGPRIAWPARCYGGVVAR